MQNIANFKREFSPQGALWQKQKPALREAEGTEDSKISAKSTPKLRFSVTTNFFYNCRESSTNRPSFLQNKANLLDTQTNVSSVKTRNYENKRFFRRRENKPKQSQFQT
jgi:hypothetical protein